VGTQKWVTTDAPSIQYLRSKDFCIVSFVKKNKTKLPKWSSQSLDDLKLCLYNNPFQLETNDQHHAQTGYSEIPIRPSSKLYLWLG
jgi:hypothetical protein